MTINEELIKGICPKCRKRTGYTYEVMGYVTCWSCARMSQWIEWKNEK